MVSHKHTLLCLLDDYTCWIRRVGGASEPPCWCWHSCPTAPYSDVVRSEKLCGVLLDQSNKVSFGRSVIGTQSKRSSWCWACSIVCECATLVYFCLCLRRVGVGRDPVSKTNSSQVLNHGKVRIRGKRQFLLLHSTYLQLPGAMAEYPRKFLIQAFFLIFHS